MELTITDCALLYIAISLVYFLRLVHYERYENKNIPEKWDFPDWLEWSIMAFIWPIPLFFVDAIEFIKTYFQFLVKERKL